jgi:hypothetical protein
VQIYGFYSIKNEFHAFCSGQPHQKFRQGLDIGRKRHFPVTGMP